MLNPAVPNVCSHSKVHKHTHKKKGFLLQWLDVNYFRKNKHSWRVVHQSWNSWIKNFQWFFQICPLKYFTIYNRLRVHRLHLDYADLDTQTVEEHDESRKQPFSDLFLSTKHRVTMSVHSGLLQWAAGDGLVFHGLINTEFKKKDGCILQECKTKPMLKGASLVRRTHSHP